MSISGIQSSIEKEIDLDLHGRVGGKYLLLVH